MTTVLDLPARIVALEGDAAERVAGLLDVAMIEGSAVPSPELEPWVEATFGSVEAVRHQPIVRVTNRATLESTIFAPLRARRPMDGAGAGDLAAEIAATEGDPFCHPETGTPAETDGRVRGRHMTTGANAAQADAHHAVLVFDRHDPLAFDAELVTDLLVTGRAWADRTHAADPEATAYLLAWNCLWRAGGSIVHGHAQAVVGRGRPHAAVDRFVRDAAAHRAATGRHLVADLVAAHRDLGLAVDADGVSVLAHLTPRKEREVLVVGPPDGDERDPAFAAAVTRALLAYRDRLEVRSFNLALWRRPLGATESRWDGIGPLVRLVDRGDLFSRSSDIGAMELYGTPIVGSDPYEVVAALG